MKVLRVYQVEMLTAILFVVLVCCFFKGYEKEKNTEYISYNEGWTCRAGEEMEVWDELPKKVLIPEGKEELTLEKELDETVDSGNCIGFYTSHQLVQAYIDGELIYEHAVLDYTNSRTPGNCWNYIWLEKEYAGKLLTIHIENCYDSGKVHVPEFYYGSQSAMMMRLIRENGISFLVSVVIFMTGVMLLCSWCLIGKRMNFHKGIPWVGIFAINFSIWSAMETQILAVLFERELLFSKITFMSIKLMVFPILYFIRIIYHMESSRFLNGLCILSVLDFTVSFIGQFLGFFDFRQTIWFTHILGILAVLLVLVMGVKTIIKRGRRFFRRGHKTWIHMVGLGIVGVCMLIDAVNYYYGFYPDTAASSRVGCLIYIIILTVQLMEESIKLIEAGKEVEAIREDAQLDGLTKLKNRRAFEVDLNRISRGAYKKYSIVMFDLNNLKLMNDVYGHGMGDYYIISGSEIIRDLFGAYGEVYRIGGDEFCMISDSLTEEEYIQKEQRMCEWIKSLRGVQVKDYMQIASGYARFNQNRDMNLLDTKGRADEEMYRRKREQKNEKE